MREGVEYGGGSARDVWKAAIAATVVMRVRRRNGGQKKRIPRRCSNALRARQARQKGRHARRA